MLRILFVYGRENPKTLYKQGMNELLAPIVYLLTQEKLPHKDDSDTLSFLLNEEYLEHDAFTIFTELMNTTGEWFILQKPKNPVPKAPLFEDGKRTETESTIVWKCREMHFLLKERDPALFFHLEKINIEPQIYALRWVRLLLSREFHLDDVLILWDAIFAYDKSFTLITYICVAMLIYIRQELIGQDESVTLKRLFKFPPVEDVFLFVKSALTLIQGGTIMPLLPLSVPTLPLSSSSPSTTITTTTPTPLTPTVPSPSSASSNPSTPLRGHQNQTNSQPLFSSNLKAGEKEAAATPLTSFGSVPVSSHPLTSSGGNVPNSSAQPPVARSKQPLLSRDQLFGEISEMKASQNRMADRLDSIIASLQQEFSGLSGGQSDETVLLAIANLKQIKDILSGHLPDPHSN
eukprot:TRINITY_DN4462_c0_g1_i2.p1 TRINITY_DN4462_c0_g1~~TRINITY_DN4462_c0_g1_i2.p1  ORF type:complete len:405 (+),score=83.14 TRINITY_DN4462_c0_g1_i2:455-1669(+)